MFPAFMDAASFLLASPSKTCKVRVSASRYRNDPYRARVLPRISPVTPSNFASRFYVPSAAIMPITAPTTYPAYPMLEESLLPRALMEEPAFVASQESLDATPFVETPTIVKASPAPARGPTEHFALVGFKHETAMYRAPFRVAVGDVVIVEADRGEHIGIVQSLTTTKPSYNVPCRVARRASAAEAAEIDELTAKEKRIAAAVQKQSESLGLGIRIVDVEFQLDMNKLTIFFASKCFVDFRKLQRALFREYRCRIWLVNWAEVREYTPVAVNAPSA